MLRLRYAMPLLAILSACKGGDDKGGTDSGSQETGDTGGTVQDLDDDGFNVTDDCDDSDPAIHPDALEECDGIDNDCDDQVDEGVMETRYGDADGDGFGDPDLGVTDCEFSDDKVPNSDDCDDSDPYVYPDAEEICDNQDNDCDGNTDEAATDAVTWYIDADADGYGDDEASVESCEEMAGYSRYGGDCDDSDPAFNPGAAETDCTDPTDYNCDGSTGYADADDDGYAACAECDDADPTHYPGATEACDGADDDCDGIIDEDDAADAVIWYADSDGDRFGDASSITVACDAPEGYVGDDSDCDDGSDTIYPGADETCNDLDDDCDDVVDEDPTDGLAWFEDTDQDGFGDPDAELYACDQPDGAVEDATDCDDNDPETYPGADETCDGADDDCDGEADEDDAIDAPTWYADEDGDTFGDAGVSTVSCEAPEGMIDDDTDCDDADADINPGMDETCNTVDDDCDGEADEDDAVDALTWYADADADSFGDPDEETRACELPSGFVADATDCEDDDDQVYPGADETCNDIDDDCDDVADEDDAIDALTWYADDDDDSFGDASSTTLACEAPRGYVADDTDCDDDDEMTNPEADETCDGADDDCDGETDEDDAVDATTWYRDRDRDLYGEDDRTRVACERPGGYRADGGDCDDDDATIYPGATETCDGVDQDCDDVVDDDATDATTFYADADEDAYGDPDNTMAACELADGYVLDDTDCDDGDETVNPGARERCDDEDDDCDGAVDDDATDASTWYRDRDSDGYGDGDTTSESCDQPTGYADLSDDCDDSDDAIYPGAAETCDGVDQDCDGAIDDDAIDLNTWYPDADRDGYGDEASATEACDAPTSYTSAGGDCDDSDDEVNPDATEVCDDGLDNDCDGGSNECALSGDDDLSAADATLLGEDGSDRAGSAVASAGDVDGDGYDDLIVGAPGNDRRASSAGAAYVVLGAPASSVSLDLADAILVGEAGADSAGKAVGGGGDVDGDGYDDVLVGAEGNDSGGSSSGAAYLLSGPIAGTSSLSSADTTFIGEDASDYAGVAVDLLGDLDGDGEADVGVGANAHATGGVKGGAVYVLFSPASGDVDLSTRDAEVYGESTYDYASVPSEAGDVDGDGYDDLLVGAEGLDEGFSGAGAALLFLGPITGALAASDADGLRYGEEASDAAGSALDGAGDVDGDGYADVIVGATKADYGSTRDTGAAYLLLGPWSGSDSLSESDARRYGEARSDSAGVSVAGAGDTDGDGHADLLIGGYYHDDGGADAGTAWLLLGPVSGSAQLSGADASWTGEAAGDYAGYSVSTAGDVDGDGKTDLFVGAYYNDSAATNAGAAYVLLGAGL